MRLRSSQFFIMAVCLLCLSVTPSKAAPPNVIILLSDDQNWTDYSHMGHPQIQTPHLDQLARESLVFTRGYVPSSLCRPSLLTLMTGRYPHQHGVVGNDPPPTESLAHLGKGALHQHPDYKSIRREYIRHIDDEETIATLLTKRGGYASLQTGKWWEGAPSRGGFTQAMSTGDLDRGGRHGDIGLKIGRETLQPIFDFMDQSTAAQQPFFIWYAPMLPHNPHTPPERLLAKYRDKTPHLAFAKYWAMCEWYDETCGEILKHLEQTGQAENTIVISITDNGWLNRLEDDNYAARSKRSPYDGGIRTPLLIRWPARIMPDRDEVTLASSIDILPTILAAVEENTAQVTAGVVSAGGRDSEAASKAVNQELELPGLNLLDEEARNTRQQIFGEIFEHDVQHLTDPLPSLTHRWTIWKNWKLIVPNPGRPDTGRIELYDLTSDPFEHNDLSGSEPELVSRLRADLDRFWPAAASAGP